MINYISPLQSLLVEKGALTSAQLSVAGVSATINCQPLILIYRIENFNASFGLISLEFYIGGILWNVGINPTGTFGQNLNGQIIFSSLNNLNIINNNAFFQWTGNGANNYLFKYELYYLKTIT
tara:strand:- start:2282 stop:2650 length:369 start_codon:yes stop_codon:yes gene_type:complete